LEPRPLSRDFDILCDIKFANERQDRLNVTKQGIASLKRINNKLFKVLDALKYDGKQRFLGLLAQLHADKDFLRFALPQKDGDFAYRVNIEGCGIASAAEDILLKLIPFHRFLLSCYGSRTPIRRGRRKKYEGLLEDWKKAPFHFYKINLDGLRNIQGAYLSCLRAGTATNQKEQTKLVQWALLKAKQTAKAEGLGFDAQQWKTIETRLRSNVPKFAATTAAEKVCAIFSEYDLTPKQLIHKIIPRIKKTLINPKPEPGTLAAMIDDLLKKAPHRDKATLN
jgi:hypothetical protein